MSPHAARTSPNQTLVFASVMSINYEGGSEMQLRNDKDWKEGNDNAADIG